MFSEATSIQTFVADQTSTQKRKENSSSQCSKRFLHDLYRISRTAPGMNLIQPAGVSIPSWEGGAEGGRWSENNSVPLRTVVLGIHTSPLYFSLSQMFPSIKFSVALNFSVFHTVLPILHFFWSVLGLVLHTVGCDGYNTENHRFDDDVMRQFLPFSKFPRREENQSGVLPRPRLGLT